MMQYLGIGLVLLVAVLAFIAGRWSKTDVHHHFNEDIAKAIVAPDGHAFVQCARCGYYIDRPNLKQPCPGRTS